jgi:REP element-mobilizing transposase RayT
MPNYRRNRVPGGCYFFTVNLLERHQNFLLIDEIELLRTVVKQVKDKHTIRDDRDYTAHMDYLHYNPVKHGFVKSPIDWPHSSFETAVKRGYYERDWGGDEPVTIKNMDRE